MDRRALEELGVARRFRGLGKAAFDAEETPSVGAVANRAFLQPRDLTWARRFAPDAVSDRVYKDEGKR
jgi:hypothetical protein